jgi:anti-sigma B factor antagonist
VTLLARVIETRHGDVLVAAVEGEVDASNTDEIADRLRTATSNRTTSLIVDLSETTYLDSAGINMLFELSTDLRERQQRLLLVVPPSSPILRAIGITGLDSAVPTHPDREAALAAAG